MAYTTIDNPEAYFQANIHTSSNPGSGGTQAVTLSADTDMQPDLVWLKNRASGSTAHTLFDAVRGTGKMIKSDSDGAEDSNSQYGYLSAFNSDGFTLLGGSTNANYVAQGTDTYVAWCWKANGSGSSDTTGTINSTATSANTTAGFSIVKYSSGGGSGTVGHSLGSVPKVMVYKPLSTSGGWDIYHHSLGIGNRLNLHNTVASSSGYFQTLPTSSVFTEPNLYSGQDVLMYCFAPVQGYSAMGSYIGNGSSSGSTIWCGFRPAFVMVKYASPGGGVGDWNIYDNKRKGYNDENDYLAANATSAENSSDNQVDLLSNGFKWRTTDSDTNESGSTYVYMAFAEAPFVNSNGVPCNAR